MESLLHNVPPPKITTDVLREELWLGLNSAKELSPLSNRQLGLTEKAVSSPARLADTKASKSADLKTRHPKEPDTKAQKGPEIGLGDLAKNIIRFLRHTAAAYTSAPTAVPSSVSLGGGVLEGTASTRWWVRSTQREAPLTIRWAPS